MSEENIPETQTDQDDAKNIGQLDDEQKAILFGAMKRSNIDPKNTFRGEMKKNQP